MLQILVAKKPLDRKVQASEIPGKDAEKSVRALEDFEIEQDQSFEDWIEIIDHAVPKTPRAVVMNANKAINQDYVVITKNTELDSIKKKKKKKASVSDGIVLVKDPKLTRLSGNVKK
ncbi:uncharacterized protein FOBCDRAFT_245808 [Fusarium oxysporum Fo47]|uniref:Uncharacterized protein n=1 Tax=Fusarium oxysporum Fo47 TaxID=660027 RepID=W9JMH5_FUSOX|nr:uncharacterized protein FOBCDRAFT_245808 [Fusarium oxysporum Fo47]EWZ33186.1 hypothetical protein FOZG_12949 [Fusarium oxysporum Fo47]QKD62501.1 hypothetical protein FOBCDRAFT_245808 [Fusarium oxysporum Fo47]